MQNNKNNQRFTIIDHNIQKNLNLSSNEYMVANTIYRLSTSTKNLFKGWCGAKKETIANFLNLSVRTIPRILKNLEEKGIIEIKPKSNRKLIKTTTKWKKEFDIDDIIEQQEESATMADLTPPSMPTWQTSPATMADLETPTNPYKSKSKGQKDTPDKEIYKDIYNNNKLSFFNDSGNPTEIKNTITISSHQFGDPEVNYVYEEGLKILEIPTYDGSIKDNRKYAKMAINKFKQQGGRDAVLAIFRASMESSFWRGKITSFHDVLRNGMKVASSVLSEQKGGRLSYVD